MSNGRNRTSVKKVRQWQVYQIVWSGGREVTNPETEIGNEYGGRPMVLRHGKLGGDVRRMNRELCRKQGKKGQQKRFQLFWMLGSALCWDA